MTGTGIESYLARFEYRISNNSNLPAPSGQIQTATTEDEPTTIDVLGTVYNVFVPGVSDPEGTGDDVTYIP